MKYFLLSLPLIVLLFFVSALAGDMAPGGEMVVNTLQDSFSSAKELSANLRGDDQSKALVLNKAVEAEIRGLEKRFKKYGNISKQELEAESIKAFDLLKMYWELIDRSKKKGYEIQTVSDSPHHCSNHCYKSCGYNSLGDKICYNKCVKCCNKKGC